MNEITFKVKGHVELHASKKIITLYSRETTKNNKNPNINKDFYDCERWRWIFYKRQGFDLLENLTLDDYWVYGIPARFVEVTIPFGSSTMWAIFFAQLLVACSFFLQMSIRLSRELFMNVQNLEFWFSNSWTFDDFQGACIPWISLSWSQ